eukprot:gene8918-18455_t
MQSLFPQHSQQGSRQQQPVLQFKAGKCSMVPQPGGKFLVNPELQKGMISLTKTNDNLISFQWADRTTHSVDAGLILFPDDVDFKKVNTGRSNDRVYMLKWRTGGKVLMFWLQDKNTAKDAENSTKVNELINNPNSAVETAANDNATGTGMGPEAWMQLLGLGGAGATGASTSRRPDASTVPGTSTSRPAAAPATTPAAPASMGLLGNLDLSSILQGAGTAPNHQSSSAMPRPTNLFASPTPAATSSTSTLTSEQLQRAMAAISNPMALQQQQSRAVHPGLQDILSPESVLSTGILDDAAVREALAQVLPEGQQSPEYVEEAIRSPQLRQALRALSEGLSGENYSSVLANFGISPNGGTEELVRGNPVGAFVAALQADVAAAAAANTSPHSDADTAGPESQEQKEGDESGGAPMEE